MKNYKLQRIGEHVGIILLSIAIAIALGALFAYPTMLLWNWLMPIISKGFLPQLSFLQAWGLQVLLGLLTPHATAKKNKE